MVSILSVSMFMHSRFVVSFMLIGLICTFVRDWTSYHFKEMAPGYPVEHGEKWSTGLH